MWGTIFFEREVAESYGLSGNSIPQIKISNVTEKEGTLFLHLDPENRRKILGKTRKMNRIKEVGKTLGIKDVKIKGYRE